LNRTASAYLAASWKTNYILQVEGVKLSSEGCGGGFNGRYQNPYQIGDRMVFGMATGIACL